MPDRKPLSKRVKAFLWISYSTAFLIFALVGVSLIFGNDPEPELIVVEHPPTPTRVPVRTATPTNIHTIASHWNERKSIRVYLATGNYTLSKTSDCNEAKLVNNADDAVVMLLNRSAQPPMVKGIVEGHYTLSAVGSSCWATLKPARASPSAPSRSSSISVTSNQNIVGRKTVSLASGRYTLWTNSGCLSAELAVASSDALVISASRSSSKSVSVQAGRYILRAIGNGCRATLR